MDSSVVATVDIWKFIAGLGLFLTGMNHIESSLRELAGRRFKSFLRYYTTNRFFAILNGALVTALIQSSSIVMLMVIAFAGAGIISLSNSLGIILGANVGTTFTGWLVTWLGFSAKLESLIFPLISIGGLGILAIKNRHKLHFVFSFIAGFGFLLMGLDFMKEGMQSLTQVLDLKAIESFGLWAFFVVGFVITALIQSSSGMMMLTLGAVHSGLIPLSSALFVVIGADLGTTVTGLVASSRGTPVKRRVGLAHFFFNISTALLALLVANPLLEFIQQKIGIVDPLYSLVAFHSSFNFLGIILFFPFLGRFEKFLNQFFQNGHDKVCIYIGKVGTEIPEASIEAIHKESDRFLMKVFQHNTHILGYSFKEAISPPTALPVLNGLINKVDGEQSYTELKRIETEILEYSSSIRTAELEKNESTRLNHSILGFRNGVQSAKYMKDIHHNLTEYRNSIFEIDDKFLVKISEANRKIHQSFHRILQSAQIKNNITEDLNVLVQDNELALQYINDWIYKEVKEIGNFDTKMATFLNVNREIYSSNLFYIESLKEIFEAHKP